MGKATVVTVLLASRGENFCRGCNAPIVWFETKAGKRQPFNADAVAVPLAAGLLPGEAMFGTIESRYAHHATCPVAPAFRRRK